MPSNSTYKKRNISYIIGGNIHMTKEFWKAAFIRALKTVCQTAVATIGTAMVVTDVDWVYVVSASLLAGILSLLTSISVGLPEVQLTDTLYALDNDPDDYDDEEDEFEEFEDIEDFEDDFVVDKKEGDE